MLSVFSAFDRLMSDIGGVAISACKLHWRVAFPIVISASTLPTRAHISTKSDDEKMI